MSTSIRQKITLFNLFPAFVFYCFITFVFLYFSFRTVSAEISLRHLNQTMRYAALINGNINNVILAGQALALSVGSDSYGKLSEKISSLFGDVLLIKNIAVIDFQTAEGVLRETAAEYWQRKEQHFTGSDKGKHYSIPESIFFSIIDRPDNSYQWYVRTEPDGDVDFYSSLLIKVSESGAIVRFLRIDIDGSRLIDHPIKLDPRTRLIIADPQGSIIFANGISLPKYRTVERFAHLGPCQGYGDIFFPSEFANPIAQYFFRPVKKPPDPEMPCGFLKEILNHVVTKNEAASVRIFARDTYKWHTAVPIQSVGWFFSYSILESDIMRPVIRQAVLSASLIGLAMLLSIACLWLVSGRITRPLNNLKNQMNTFGSCADDMGESSDSKDEAISLGRSFVRLKRRLLNREEALRKARANNMGNLVQQLRGSYFYFHLSSSGVITYVSPSIISALGFTVEEFSGRIQDFLTGSAVNDTFNNVLRQVPDGVWQETFELEMSHKDGSIRCIEVSCAGHLHHGVLTDKNADQSTNNSIEGMGNDITHRVRDTEKFKSLIAGSPDAIVITDSAGIINLVNARVEELFGYHECDLPGSPLALLIDPEHRSELVLLRKLDAANITSHCLDAWVSRGVDKQGYGFPVEISSNVLTTADGLLVSIVFRDITQRKQIEGELLKAKETAEKASQAKSLFLSHISHELRTPLNGVLGYAQLLLADDKIPDNYRESLSSLEACGLHLLTMINDILDITRIESGIVRSHRVSFNLQQTLDMVFASVRETAKAKGLDLQLTIDPEVHRELVGDNVKLRQVLINLMGNAVKFTDSGRVCLKVEVNGEKLQFDVLDSGPGISSTELAQLFQPFTQLERGQACGGTGLGLSISDRLVKALGGELRVESEPGRGSRFYFSIPYQVDPVDSSKDSDTLPPVWIGPGITGGFVNKRRIPKVDDSSINRDMQVKVVKSGFFHVDSAFLRLSDRSRDEVMTTLKHALEIGDLKLLEEKAESWSYKQDYGTLPENIISLCKSLDVQSLESLYSALLDYSSPYPGPELLK